MHNKKILLIFGTRPEAIKLAPLYKILKSKDSSFELITCTTGQHKEMLQQVMEIFDISSDIDLDLMRANQDLSDLTANILTSIRDVIRKVKPDLVIVHGDTTTAFGSSLASFYESIPVAHVEAGLRTNNLYEPFPEEFNRQIATKISHLHFAPTELSKMNLISENISKDKIFVTGNTVIDSLFLALNNLEQDKNKSDLIYNEINKLLGFDSQKKDYILITGHRRENFGDGFLNICHAIKELAQKFQHFNFIYPVHLNPNVQKPVKSILRNISNVKLIEPLQYLHFLLLLKNCYLILTDSGGIQEEAPSLGKPVLVMRNTTERPEGVRSNTLKLIGTKKENIIKNVSELIEKKDVYNEMSNSINPYGDGTASKKILDILEDFFK
ncbi:MAG: UDP-N-acetylglucosamine 2-epimerase (non-hydrolyzing) [Gammaproteobacteria bacterium]|nr:UDP-N-acetylglucosamine 2-epimerase (non-hydrolyzing) [Gammaproteobacteria bacterium]